MQKVSQPEVLSSGHETLEGPAFDRADNLFFVDWVKSSVLRLTPDGALSEFFNTGGIPAGLAFHPDGSLYIADEGENIHGVMRVTIDGASEILVNEYEGSPLNGANDLVFDRDGVLYFSDPWGSGPDNPIGGFYRFFPDRRLERIDTGLMFPNGVALEAEERAVYLAETDQNRILRYPILADGSMGPREHWANTGSPRGPDGMAFDIAGNLYVAHYGGGRVDVFDRSGALTGEISIPGNNPTNVAFGGPKNRTLVVTEVETGSIYRMDSEVAGQPLNDGR